MPVFAGIPILISAIGTFITSIVAGILSIVTRQLIIRTIAVAAMIAVTIAFFALLLNSMESLIVTMPPSVTQYVGMFMPSNFYTCVSAIITAKVLRWIYDWKMDLIKTYL